VRPTTPKGCLLVMDGGRARVFAMRRAPRTFQNLFAVESARRHTPARELMSDAAPRSRHGVGNPASHTKVPRIDPRELEERQFVDQVVRELAAIQSREGFEELVLVADPRTLGRLRNQLGKPLSERVTAEFNWDLAGLKDADIETRLWSAMGWAA